MSEEKKAVIAPGVTPPEEEGQKQASVEQLEQHLTKRAADAVEEAMKKAARPPVKE